MDEVDGLPFYAMQRVRGPSLGRVLHSGPVEGRHAARYMEAVARAVHYGHESGILHRDLKPHNILLDPNDEPLVADFGLAKLLEDPDVTVAGEVLGTPAFMSPEQAKNAACATAASDVYSLGATLYALVTGRPPFQAADNLETL